MPNHVCRCCDRAHPARTGRPELPLQPAVTARAAVGLDLLAGTTSRAAGRGSSYDRRRPTRSPSSGGSGDYGGGIEKAVLFAVLASIPLPLGAWIGTRRPPSRTVTAALLAFASGALITAVAFELFDEAFQRGGAWRAGVAFLGGATAFIVVDTWLDRYTKSRQASGLGVGIALLAGVTLDGVPENIAMGVGLIQDSSPALLVAIVVSNFPEAVVGAQKMGEARLARRTIMLIWSATGLLLAAAVVAGYPVFDGLSDDALAWPLGFAGGAVLASLADTLMPEAFAEADEQPSVAYATALGFLVSYLVSVG